jgi:hypothetical protein
MVRPMRASVVVAVIVASVVTLADAASSAAPPRGRAKAAPKAAPPSSAPASTLTVLETVERPKTDYQAEVYSGVALDEPYAKDRGLANGLVLMVFEKQRRPAFRVPREKIKKLVRLVAEDGAPVMLVKAVASPARTKIDVLETDDGWIAVETVTTNGGIFTTSDVYAFAKGASLDQRFAALGSVPAIPRERLKRALAMAAAARP